MADKYCLGSVTFTPPTVLLDTVLKSGTATLTDSIFNYNLIAIVTDYGTADYQTQTNMWYIGKNKNNIITGSTKATSHFIVCWGNGSANSFERICVDSGGTVLTVTERAGNIRVAKIYGIV